VAVPWLIFLKPKELIRVALGAKVKSSQVVNFQIGTNKCAMQRAQPSKKRKYAASGALI